MRMGANHSFIHLNPLSMLARRMKEGRMLPKVKALLGMIGPKGKGRSGILCGACKRALAGIAPLRADGRRAYFELAHAYKFCQRLQRVSTKNLSDTGAVRVQ